jgi:hypothetical protein
MDVTGYIKYVRLNNQEENKRMFVNNREENKGMFLTFWVLCCSEEPEVGEQWKLAVFHFWSGV